MTPFADLHTDKAITSLNFWREKSCPQKDQNGEKGKKG
jgi:hypothetical protein